VSERKPSGEKVRRKLVAAGKTAVEDLYLVRRDIDCENAGHRRKGASDKRRAGQ
jgi:hypothetical protein